MKRRIVIVGAGPIGCYLARLLRKNSFEIVLLEEHPHVGLPIHCAGLLGKEVFKNPLSNSLDRSILNQIDGAEIIFGKESFFIHRKESAFVVRRDVFDQSLSCGLPIKHNTRVNNLEKHNSGYLVETENGEFTADIVIGADGARSLVRDMAGLNGEIKYLSGFQFRMKTNLSIDHIVRVYMRRPSFVWIIPEGKGIVRLGTISNHPYYDLKNFLNENNIKGEILDKFSGVVPVGTCCTVGENIALVGDAACQVKPLTYGGIYYGMKCAEILADTLINGELRKYETLWRKKFGTEINMGFKIKNTYLRLTDKEMKDIFIFMKKNSDIIERYGHFENHSNLLWAILKDAKFKDKLGSIVWNIFKEMVGL